MSDCRCGCDNSDEVDRLATTIALLLDHLGLEEERCDHPDEHLDLSLAVAAWWGGHKLETRAAQEKWMKREVKRLRKTGGIYHMQQLGLVCTRCIAGRFLRSVGGVGEEHPA